MPSRCLSCNVRGGAAIHGTRPRKYLQQSTTTTCTSMSCPLVRGQVSYPTVQRPVIEHVMITNLGWDTRTSPRCSRLWAGCNGNP